MGVSKEQLQKLGEAMPYKYRLQSAKYGKATIVSYCDSRQIQDRFDDVCGEANWKNEFATIAGNLYCGISVKCKTESGEDEWVTKWDVGTESNIDPEKGGASSALKRSAVLWKVGRFLYSLGIITLKTGSHKDKEYPATDEGNILWGVDELTEYCKKVVESGELDRTKKGVKPLKTVVNTTQQPVAKVTPTVTKPEEPKGAIKPSTEFDKTDDSLRKEKALEALNKLDTATVLKHIIQNHRMKYTSIKDLVAGENIDKILSIYTELTAK